MFEKLKELLVEELQIDEKDITMEAELSNDLNINSIELPELVLMCEEKFGITIQDDDIRKFNVSKCLFTNLLQVLKSELVTNGKCDKSQCNIRNQ